MPERHSLLKIRPVYFYIASAALFVGGGESCYQSFAADVRAHDEADRLYVNGERENSEYAQQRLEDLDRRGHHINGLIALSASGGAVFAGRLFRENKKTR